MKLFLFFVLQKFYKVYQLHGWAREKCKTSLRIPVIKDQLQNSLWLPLVQYCSNIVSSLGALWSLDHEAAFSSRMSD